MSNIFKLTDDFKSIVDMADQLDPQTLEDMLEAIGDATADKVANTIAVIKSVKGELDVAKDFKKDLEARIKSMNNTIDRLNEYIQLGVETVGTPKKGAEHFRKLEIGAPWVKSAWTQFNPPAVEIVDEKMIDDEFMIPQPPKPDGKAIATAWKAMAENYEVQRTAFIMDLQKRLDETELNELQADLELEQFEKDHAPKIAGVEVRQTVGVRFR